jgi:hypothetical protein
MGNKFRVLAVSDHDTTYAFGAAVSVENVL